MAMTNSVAPHAMTISKVSILPYLSHALPLIGKLESFLEVELKGQRGHLFCFVF